MALESDYDIDPTARPTAIFRNIMVGVQGRGQIRQCDISELFHNKKVPPMSDCRI